MTINTAMHHIINGKQYYIVDIDVAHLFRVSSYGPSLFHAHHTTNILHPSSHSPGISRPRNHSVIQLLIGADGSYTRIHVDFFAFDGWLKLHSGRKLWVYVQPKHAEAFKKCLDGKLSMMNLTDEDRAEMTRLNVRGIVQEAGDTVWMPTGWAHFVLNLAPSIGYGGSILRKEGLIGMREYIKSQFESDDQNHKEAVKETCKQLSINEVMNKSSKNKKYTQSQRAAASSIIKLLKD